MNNNKSILSYIFICCMMIFCSNGIFAQGTNGEYPGAGVGFDSGCGYPDAGNNDPGVSDTGLAGNACGSAFDATFGPWVETADGFDISGFELNSYDIDQEAAYGIRLFYGPQDDCCTICLDAMIDLGQGATCGTFGPQVNLSSFGYPIPANYGEDIFGSGNVVIPYDNMCPNTEYFAQYQLISATAVDLTDPDGNFCAMDDALITNSGTMTTVQTLVAPGTRDPIVINAATFTPVAPADCAATDVLFDFTVDVTSGCEVSFGTCSKGLEVELRASLSCGDGSTITLNTGPLINDPNCPTGVAGTTEYADQISLGAPADLCAILACDPAASLEVYARHTFCEADAITGDGSSVDEAVLSISIASILAQYGDAGAMCCAQACPSYNAATISAGCNVYDICIGYTDTDQDGIGDGGEDPTGTMMTVDVGAATGGTAINDGIFFFGGNAVGYCFTYQYDEQGCAPVDYPGTVTLTCPDGTPGVLDLTATGGPVVNLTSADIAGDAFGVPGGGAFYPTLTQGTVTPAVCPTLPDNSDGVAASVQVTSPDGTVCTTVMGDAPTCGTAGGNATTTIQLNPITDPLLSALFGADPTFPYTCTIDETADLSFDCAVCTVCPDISALAADATDVCTGDNITVTLTLSAATEGGEVIQVNGQDPDSGVPIAANLMALTYTIAAPANTGCASAPLTVEVTTATCMDNSPITDTSVAATINVFPNAFTTTTTDDGSTCGTPSVDLIAADGVTVCETITGAACVLDGDATAYDFATGTTLTGFPAACIPAGLSGMLTCSGCVVACPTVALTDAMPTICGGALATELADWQAAVAAANPATDPDGTSTGIIYSSINDNTAPDGDVSGITGMNMTCDPTTQIVYAFLGCDTTLPADGTPDSFQLAGTFTLTINPVLTAMEIAGSDMTAGCSTYMAALFAADGTQCAGTEMMATCVDNGDVLSLDFPADANACYAAQTVTAPNACAGCGMCAITPQMATAITCDNNGTPTDPSDDTFTFTITVDGNNPAVGASQTFNDDQGNAGIAYGTAVNYGPYPISGGNITVNFTDADDAACTAMMMAAAPATCSMVCQDDIAGSIMLADCDFAGTMVNIYDPSGALLATVPTDAMGNYSLTGGPFPCGTYTAEITAAPACYVDEGGSVGPIPFEVDGDGIPDGVDFMLPVANIPTVGEWGLIILGLLMSITAIVGIRARREEEAMAI